MHEPANIIELSARIAGVTAKQMNAKDRKPKSYNSRFLAFYMLQKHTILSTDRIAELFDTTNNRVCYCLKSIRRKMILSYPAKHDRELIEMINECETILNR